MTASIASISSRRDTGRIRERWTATGPRGALAGIVNVIVLGKFGAMDRELTLLTLQYVV
jgi:hypothetical protein